MVMVAVSPVTGAHGGGAGCFAWRCPTAMCPTVSHCWRDTILGAAGAGELFPAQPDGTRHGTEAPGASTMARDWVRTNLPGRAQLAPRSLSYLQEINVHRVLRSARGNGAGG